MRKQNDSYHKILTNVIQKDGIFFIVTLYLCPCSSPTDKVIVIKSSLKEHSTSAEISSILILLSSILMVLTTALKDR